jgi:hypothetical protein
MSACPDHPDAEHLEPGLFYCAVPEALVNGDVVMCAGLQFKQTADDRCELVFLSEADVERLTGPEDD